ncbi:hypothetical protein ACFLKB_17900 (plasmid) [Clostridium sp. FAM 1755]|uniref:hypothetical protein n=1 Tax=Clostridium caseinilyticum TaxID=3350403 RepID=UPI0038F6D446
MTNYTKKNENKQEVKTVLDKCTDKKRKNPKFTSYIAPLTTKKNIERTSEWRPFIYVK